MKILNLTRLNVLTPSAKNYKPLLKTKKNKFVMKFTSVCVVLVFSFLASCEPTSGIINAIDAQNVNAEAASAAYINESADLASSAVSGLTNSQYSSSGLSGLAITGLSQLDDRIGSCATVTLTTAPNSGALAGRITISYDSSCADAYGVIRKGTVIISYLGARWQPGSSINVRLVNYYRNDDHVEGNLTLAYQITSPDTLHVYFNSVLDSGKVTFADGRFITRSQIFTRQWIRSIVSSSNNQWITLANSLGDSTGFASGITKGGKAYTSQITKQLVEKVTCRVNKVFIPVSGTKIMKVGNEQYTLDYGAGICDNLISISLNGKAKQVTVTPEGN